jgi:hypothetical protein
MPSIPSACINLVVTSSQMEILLVEKEHVQEQAYSLTEVVREGSALHNEIQRNEKV